MDENILSALKNFPGVHSGYFNDSEQKCLSTLVECGKVVARYVDNVPHYYLPEQVMFCSGMPYVTLTSAIHEDGTVHVCFNEIDVGIKISSDKTENIGLKSEIDKWIVSENCVAEIVHKRSKRIAELTDERIRMKHDREILRETLKTAVQQADDLRNIAVSDTAAWEKRMESLIQTIKTKDSIIYENNATISGLLDDKLALQNTTKDHTPKLESVSDVDSVVWKKRESELLGMNNDLNNLITWMNTTFQALWKRAEVWKLSCIKGDVQYGGNYTTMDDMYMQLSVARGKCVFVEEYPPVLDKDMEYKVSDTISAANVSRTMQYVSDQNADMREQIAHLERVNYIDRDIWKKIEADRDEKISAMNDALCRTLRVAERDGLLIRDEVLRELYSDRDRGVFTDAD